MGKTYLSKCPHCGTDLELSADCFGHEIECPGCLQIYTPEMKWKRKKASEAGAQDGLTASDRATCYMSGLFLGIVGVFVGQMVGGVPGVKLALRGLVINMALCIGIYMLWTCGVIHRILYSL